MVEVTSASILTFMCVRFKASYLPAMLHTLCISFYASLSSSEMVHVCPSLLTYSGSCMYSHFAPLWQFAFLKIKYAGFAVSSDMDLPEASKLVHSPRHYNVFFYVGLRWSMFLSPTTFQCLSFPVPSPLDPFATALGMVFSSTLVLALT